MPCNLCLSAECNLADHERLVAKYIEDSKSGITAEHFTCTICLGFTYLPYATESPFFKCVCYPCILTPIPTSLNCPAPTAFLANRTAHCFVTEMMKYLWNVVPSKGYSYEIIDKRAPRIQSRIDRIAEEFSQFRGGLLFRVDDQQREVRIGSRIYDFSQISHTFKYRRMVFNETSPAPAMIRRNPNHLDIITAPAPLEVRPDVVLVSESETDEIEPSVDENPFMDAVDRFNNFLDRITEDDA
jgi:hypothetical protein